MVYNPSSPTGCGVMPDRIKPEIEIHIKSNRSHIGTTTVAAVVANALKAAGMKNVHVKCKDGDFMAVSTRAINRPSGTIISDDTCNVMVTIVDENELIDGAPRGR